MSDPAPAVEILPPREAYRLWAPVYAAETAVSYLDDLIVGEMTPPARGMRVLDAGCGTGRRLRGVEDAALRVGADLTPEMLAAAEEEGAPAFLACADVRALPFAAEAFDVVWCRLVLGHLPAVRAAYAELARVTRPGGTVVVTDFHEAAVRAGHVRAFRDAGGELREVEHHVHPAAAHLLAAAAAGLELAARRNGVVGPELRPFYARAGRLERYEADAGLPLVLALSFRRAPRGD